LITFKIVNQGPVSLFYHVFGSFWRGILSRGIFPWRFIRIPYCSSPVWSVLRQRCKWLLRPVQQAVE